MAKSCNRRALAWKIAKVRNMRVAPIMKPLRDHVLRLATDSAKHGYCQRAGREIAKARKISESTPTAASYTRAVTKARYSRSRR